MADSQHRPDDLSSLADEAVALADRWRRDAAKETTAAERDTSDQLAALLRDEAGLALAVKFVDEVARPEDPHVAAKALSSITAKDAAFLGRLDRTLLTLGTKAAQIAPALVVPIARRRLRQIVGHLIVDATDPTLGRHLAKAQADGFRLNVNLLGEAVLGEREAASRAQRTRELLERDDVDYVSIKVSSLVSQVSTWDTTGTVRRVVERLRPLYRAASRRSPHAFVNLDMEEYRDLDLTLDVFEHLLSEPEFELLEAGVVLQAYLPDAVPALERLIRFAQQRRSAGGAPIKIRVVKGANLAMEDVEAEVHGWAQAPYTSKEDVDANYLRFIERALRLDASGVLRLGVASHNLYDVAFAHLLAERRGVTDQVDIEMLQGMAPAEARVVKRDVGAVLLYTPVVAAKDFDVAVSYLIRRLEENAQPQNFLHAMFSAPESSDGGPAMRAQERRFRESLAAIDLPTVGPRRSPSRPPIGDRFANTPDSDPSLPATRAWGRKVVAAAPPPVTVPRLTATAEVDDAVALGVAGAAQWAALSPAERAGTLRRAAVELESRRGVLVTVMAAEGGKTIDQSDPEISEAIDFARYYADRALDLAPGSLMADGATFVADRLVLVTPPWNFPVAIPIGGVLAALAAGAAVIIKPAPAVPGCTQVAVEALWAAGVPRDVLQVVQVDENEVGQHLIAHPDIDTVVLTGAIETARLFASWRTEHAQGPRVYAETSGKNALVITAAADIDLAVNDLVKSAFGHAGQKCSAASLGILVGSAGKSKRLRNQLIDAVSSLRVGWPDDLGTTMGPVIERPTGKLHRSLTTLEPGETWLVEPRQLDATGRLWSPGLKDGVRPGSHFHLTEVFGPVLGLMHADSLEQAIEWQNAPRFGLTGGLHSLDEDEIEQWREQVQVGNAYLNRVTTGAIVQRQPFGGWKDSVVGPGAKAGGPNYVAQLGRWVADGLPTRLTEPAPRVKALAAVLAPLVANDDERRFIDHAARSDAAAWEAELGVERDESELASESNVFRYRPAPLVVLRCEPGTRWVDLARLLLAAELTGTPVRISLDDDVAHDLDALLARTGAGRAAREHLATLRRSESLDDLVRSLPGEPLGTRVRLLGGGAEARTALGGVDAAVLDGAVLATGRRELLTMLREQAISRTLHRFGHVPPHLQR